MSRRTVRKLILRETGKTIRVKDPGEKEYKEIAVKYSPEVRQRGEVYPVILPMYKGKQRGKHGKMLWSYCTQKECKISEIHRIVRAGAACKCGYPLSWLGKSLKERNKYADGPVNSGSADKWK